MHIKEVTDSAKGVKMHAMRPALPMVRIFLVSVEAWKMLITSMRNEHEKQERFNDEAEFWAHLDGQKQALIVNIEFCGIQCARELVLTVSASSTSQH
jgi:hypothetical protein